MITFNSLNQNIFLSRLLQEDRQTGVTIFADIRNRFITQITTSGRINRQTVCHQETVDHTTSHTNTIIAELRSYNDTMYLAETFTIRAPQQHFAIGRHIHSREHIHIWVSRFRGSLLYQSRIFNQDSSIGHFLRSLHCQCKEIIDFAVDIASRVLVIGIVIFFFSRPSRTIRNECCIFEILQPGAFKQGNTRLQQ